MVPMLAGAFLGEYSFVQIAIFIVAIAAICAIVFIGLRQMGIQIPQWFVQILWILAVAFVVIVAIKIVASM